MTQRSAANAEESASAATELDSQAGALQDLVASFRLDASRDAAAPAVPPGGAAARRRRASSSRSRVLV